MLTAGFRYAIQMHGRYSLSVCATAAALRELLLVRGPHIIVADAEYGITLDLLGDLQSSFPESSVILWFDNASTEFISQAISHGVLGVLRKNSEVELCLECLHQVSLGELWVEDDLSRKLLRTRKIHLTPGERRLMAMVAEGLANKELAHRLGLTPGTVKVYLSRLYKKVGAGDRFELALLALKNLATDPASASNNLLAGSRSAAPSMMPGYLSFEKPAVHRN